MTQIALAPIARRSRRALAVSAALATALATLAPFVHVAAGEPHAPAAQVRVTA